MHDRELLEMIGHASDYLPEALAAARLELQRRQIDPIVAVEVETSLQEEPVNTHARADRPLPWRWRIINFIFPFGVLQLPVADRYGMKGFERCRRECWSWMRRGISFWALSIFGAIALDLVWPMRGREWVVWIVFVAGLAIVLGTPAIWARRKDRSRVRTG